MSAGVDPVVPAALDEVAVPPDGGAPARRRRSRAAAAVLYGGTVAAALAGPAVKRRLARRLPEPVAEMATLVGLVGGGWATIAAAERLLPFRADWNRPRDDVATDLASLVLTGGGTQVLSEVLTAPARRRLSTRNAGGLLRRLPLPARVAVTVGLFDLGHYVHHRVAHETSLWRVHAVHHSAKRLYWFNATRFHPLELLTDGVFEAVLLAALGVDADTRIAHTILRGIYGQIQHGNLDVESGPLNAVLSTPERHRWHHSTDAVEGNTNYGAVVAVWDRAFGTDFLPSDRPFDADIGIAGRPDYPDDWVGQLVAPFTEAG